MLYYANGGPGPADKLLRVDAPKDGDYQNWRWKAKGERWSPNQGGYWFPYPKAQEDVLWSGEFTMIDDSQVEGVQQEMAREYAKFVGDET